MRKVLLVVLWVMCTSFMIAQAPTQQAPVPVRVEQDIKEEIQKIVKLRNEHGGWETAGKSDIEIIEFILDIMPYCIYDINNDGNIDCIDYSVIFHKIAGKGCEIIINNNPKNGFNHMFISYKGKYVEPQGTPDRWSMGIIWGMQFDPYYNKYVTNIWGME